MRKDIISFSIRLTHTERDSVARAAARLGWTATRFMRHAVLKQAQIIAAIPIEPAVAALLANSEFDEG